MYSPRVERRYVTRKRMEKRTPDGQLLSVTNTRTVHYNDPHCHVARRSARDFAEPQPLPPPPPPRYLQNYFHYNSAEEKRIPTLDTGPTLLRLVPDTPRKHSKGTQSNPLFIRTEPSFEHYSREDEYHKLQVVRAKPPSTPSPRRRQETVTWKREEVAQEPVYETIDRDRPERREQIYFGRQPVTGESPLSLVLNRINDLRRRNGKRELVPCPRLAAQAGRWAERIVTTGDFRRDINEKMCIWRGNRVTASIVDDWYEEAIEFRTSNYANMEWLRTVGAGSAYWPETGQTVVVVIYD